MKKNLILGFKWSKNQENNLKPVGHISNQTCFGLKYKTYVCGGFLIPDRTLGIKKRKPLKMYDI